MEIKLYVGTNQYGHPIRTAVYNGLVTFVGKPRDLKRFREEGLDRFFKSSNLESELAGFEYYETYSSIEDLVNYVELVNLLED